MPEIELRPNGSHRWTDGWRLPASGPDLGRAVTWRRAALIEATERVHDRRANAMRLWTAAVEAVWWVMALDEVLLRQVADAEGLGDRSCRYSTERTRTGGVLIGLRWLRNRHAHGSQLTGSGGAPVDFYGRDRGQAGGPRFFRSPTRRWVSAESLAPKDCDRSWQRQAYEDHVEGRPILEPLHDALRWMDSAIDALGIELTDEPDGLTAF